MKPAMYIAIQYLFRFALSYSKQFEHQIKNVYQDSIYEQTQLFLHLFLTFTMLLFSSAKILQSKLSLIFYIFLHGSANTCG